jgi:hypothetical protein
MRIETRKRVTKVTLNDEPAITVSVGRKIGLPNYSSAEASICITITKKTTLEEIEEMLGAGALAWTAMTPRLNAKIAALKGEV